MQVITLKSSSPETAAILLKGAIDREKKILEDTIRIAKEKIDSLAKTMGVDTIRLLMGEIEHTEANEMQLIELEGEIEILKHLEDKLKTIKTIEICA